MQAQRFYAAQASFLHLFNAHATRDTTLCTPWLKDVFVKGGSVPVSHLALALALELVDVHRTSAASLDALKTLLSTALKHTEFLQVRCLVSMLPSFRLFIV